MYLNTCMDKFIYNCALCIFSETKNIQKFNFNTSKSFKFMTYEGVQKKQLCCTGCSHLRKLCLASEFFCESHFTCTLFSVMADFSEQRVAMQFYFLLGKNAPETFVILYTAYKNTAIRKTQVYKWLLHFKKGEMSIDDQTQFWASFNFPNTQNCQKIHEIVFEDWQCTIEEIKLSGVT